MIRPPKSGKHPASPERFLPAWLKKVIAVGEEDERCGLGKLRCDASERMPSSAKNKIELIFSNETPGFPAVYIIL